MINLGRKRKDGYWSSYRDAALTVETRNANIDQLLDETGPAKNMPACRAILFGVCLEARNDLQRIVIDHMTRGK